MPPQPDGRSQFAVILLGASRWPNWNDMDSPAFKGSLDLFLGYVREILRVPEKRILDLFDDPRSPSETAGGVRDFLTLLTQEEEKPAELLVYYVGHGDTRGGQYRLLVSYSNQELPGNSTLGLEGLAEAIRPAGRIMRTYLIVDACFSAAATDAFRVPTGNAGLALLASASRDRVSRTPRGRDATIFTDALVKVLRRGDPGMKRQLNLREIRSMVIDEILARGNDELTVPEVHSPFQGQGIVADRRVFPNLSFGYGYGASRDLGANDDELIWCSVASESDGENGPFNDAIEGFARRYHNRIFDDMGWRLASRDRLDSLSVLESSRTFQDAVEKVCGAKLAFFDLTDCEPGVMLLLGIRSVIRRGVTICSVNESDTSFEKLRLPFLIREINITGHERGQSGPWPEDILGKKALSGLLQLKRSPQSYADLPTFEAIRRTSSDPKYERSLDAPNIPYHRRVLLLCSFGKDYFDDNWKQLHSRLNTEIIDQAGREVAISLCDAPVIERSVDISSPQIASASLFEAIRLTDFCLCDLTDWSPNVLFELGVRLASNDIDPVVILDVRDGEGPHAARAYGLARRMQIIAKQCEKLKRIIPVINYAPGVRDDYTAMVRRHLEIRRDSKLPTSTWAADGTLPLGSTYRLVWRHAAVSQEPIGINVVDSLRKAADRLSVRTGQGSNPFIFPATHAFARVAERNATETLLAAWLYLRYRFGLDALGENRLGSTFVEISDSLLQILDEPGDDRAKELMKQVVQDRDRIMDALRQHPGRAT